MRLSILTIAAGLASAQPQMELVKPSQFYLEQDSFEHSASGGAAAPGKVIRARRLDGTSVEITSHGLLVPAGLTLRQVRWPNGGYVQLIDKLKVKTTWPRNDDAPVASTAYSDCTHRVAPEVFAGYSRLLEQDVTLIQYPNGSQRVTMSAAPALSCENIAHTVETVRPDGTAIVTYEVKLTKLVAGAPDAALFDLGADYEELPPSKVMERLAKAVKPDLSPAEIAQMNSEGAAQGERLNARRAKPK